MGFQTWGTAALEALLGKPYDVPLVLTHPRSCQEYESIWSDSVKDLAQAHGICVHETWSANDEVSRRAIAAAQPDVILMSNWRTWLSPQTYVSARHTALNIHDALLPRYAGFCPINWAVANGETETGVTIHFVNEEYDLGDIILQHKVSIDFAETATDIFHKIIAAIPNLTLRALELIESGEVPRIPQRREESTFYHKRSERDSLIDWTRCSRQLHNLIRAQSSPYPNAFTFHDGRKLYVKKASLPNRAFCGTPARVAYRLEEGVVVICGRCESGPNQGLVIREVQEEGKEAQSARDYFDRMGGYLGTP